MNRIRKYFQRAILICCIATLTACGTQAISAAAQEQLDLGQKYLETMDYENAIVAFESAIEIDERIIDAYVGEAKAYEGKATNIENQEESLEVLITAYDILNEVVHDETIEFIAVNETIDSVVEYKEDVQVEFTEQLDAYIEVLEEQGDFAKVDELEEKYGDYFEEEEADVEEEDKSIIDMILGLFGGDDSSEEVENEYGTVTVTGVGAFLQGDGSVTTDPAMSGPDSSFGVDLDEPYKIPGGPEVDFLTILFDTEDLAPMNHCQPGDQISVTGEILETSTPGEYGILVSEYN